jgi:hypothetical protein
LLWALPAILAAAVVYLNVRKGRLRTWRAKRLGSVAERHGWLYSDGDVFGLGAYDFDLFKQGNVRGFANTVWGEYQGTPFQFADFWYATEYDSENAPISLQRSRRQMNVAIVRLDAYLERVRIEPESLGKKIADPGDTLDVHFESDEFNRRFRVEAADRLFAYKLIVPTMMQWLLAMPPGFGVDFYKSAVMVYSDKVDPSAAFSMVACAAGILERIPQLVWDECRIPRENAEKYWA